MKIYLSLLLVLTSLLACSTGDVKYKKKENLPQDVAFYSDEDIFKIPLCQYTYQLCSNPKNCVPLSEEISKNLSEVGTVIGEIEVKYYLKNYGTYNFYVISDKNNSKLKDFKEYEKKLNDTWGGSFTSSKENITIPLKAQIKPYIYNK